MRRVLTISFLLSFLFILPLGCQEGEEGDEVLARIGGQIISESDLEEFILTFPPDQQERFKTEEGKKILLEGLINQKILELAAKEVGLQDDPLVKMRMEYAALRVLVGEYFNRYINENMWIPEAQLKDYYEEHKDDYVAPEKVKIRCIVKKEEADSRAIYERLMKGEKFEVIATNESEDVSSRSLAGLLPEFDIDGVGAVGVARDTDIQKKAFEMEVGEISNPIVTDYGFVIIMVDERIPEGQLSFEEVRAEVARALAVSDEDIASYYDQNIDRYKQTEMYEVVSCYFSDKGTALSALEELRAERKSFSQVVEESEIEDSAKVRGGYFNWLKKGGMVSALGRSEEAEALIWAGEVGDYVGPVKGEKGWHIFYIKDYKPSGFMSLDEVYDSISDILYSQYRTEAGDHAFADLMDKYDVVNYMELGEYRTMSAKEIMEVAKNASNPVQAINAYKAVVALYPTDEQADKAQFLIGFLNAEELSRFEDAEEAFKKLLKEYPDSDFVDDARWMLENMGSEAPLSDEVEDAVDEALTE